MKSKKMQVRVKRVKPLALLSTVLLSLSVIAGCGGVQSTNSRGDVLSRALEWHADRRPMISAHRGGPMPGYPENCIATFENALSYDSCMIECDISITADSVLILLHDQTLDRTTTGNGPLSDYRFDEIRDLRLLDPLGDTTEYRIPRLDEVLVWARGKSILTLDVKRGTPYSLVISAVQQAQAESYSVIIAYRVDAAREVHALDSSLVISVPGSTTEVFRLLANSGIPFRKMIAFVGTSEPDAEVFEQWHGVGVRTILGTMGNLDRRAETSGNSVYSELFTRGADVLSTDNVPGVAEAIADSPMRSN